MRALVYVLILALAAGCGSAEPGARVERYGISMEVPEGWNGAITRGAIQLASVPPGIKLGADDVSVVLYEYELAPPESAASIAENYDSVWPPRFTAHDFAHPDSRGIVDDANAPGRRGVAIRGRYFNVFVKSGARAVSQERIDELNDALADIAVEPGDYYRGSAQPVEFPERPGWHVVSSGPSPRYPQGEYVQTAAATISYRDGPNHLPPHRTLEALPRNGILLWVSLSRDSRLSGETDAFAHRQAPPFRMVDLERFSPWEGQVRDIPEYRLWATNPGEYQVDLRVYFGRAEPTEAMWADAEAALGALRFPDWGPWELEPG